LICPLIVICSSSGLSAPSGATFTASTCAEEVQEEQVNRVRISSPGSPSTSARTGSLHLQPHLIVILPT
jgi:hypothetical protein